MSASTAAAAAAVSAYAEERNYSFTDKTAEHIKHYQDRGWDSSDIILIGTVTGTSGRRRTDQNSVAAGLRRIAKRYGTIRVNQGGGTITIRVYAESLDKHSDL